MYLLGGSSRKAQAISGRPLPAYGRLALQGAARPFLKHLILTPCPFHGWLALRPSPWALGPWGGKPGPAPTLGLAAAASPRPCPRCPALSYTGLRPGEGGSEQSSWWWPVSRVSRHQWGQGVWEGSLAQSVSFRQHAKEGEGNVECPGGWGEAASGHFHVRGRAQESQRLPAPGRAGWGATSAICQSPGLPVPACLQEREVRSALCCLCFR